ncbi:MAG: glycosyltransferase family 2 protein [Thermoleophilaceae bacterium]
MSPRVVIGGMVKDWDDHVAIAIESLLSQTYRDFRLFLVDDGSTGRMPEIVGAYAERDPRIHYVRNVGNVGTIRNWRKVFNLARETHPEAEYFTWATDHDVWHPRFLERMVAELDAWPEVVGAYPLNVRVSESGAIMQLPWAFDTFGMSDVRERLRTVSGGMVAGDMVYALFRIPALAQAGIFRGVIGPDRMTMEEVSLYGQYKQVPEVLWYRRFRWEVKASAQRAKFYPEGIPLYSYLPWWAQHGGALAYNLVVRGIGRPQISRSTGALVAATYLNANAPRYAKRKVLKRVGRMRRAVLGPVGSAVKIARFVLGQTLSHLTGTEFVHPGGPDPAERYVALNRTRERGPVKREPGRLGRALIRLRDRRLTAQPQPTAGVGLPEAHRAPGADGDAGLEAVAGDGAVDPAADPAVATPS